MKAPAAIFCVLLVASGAVADPYFMAIQQARRDSNQNAAEQQRIQNAAGDQGASSSAAAPAPGAQPMDPALAATLSNISGLQGDFAVFSNATGDKPDPSQKVSLLNDLSQAAQSKKASSDSVKKLADDLLTAVLGQKKLAAAPQRKLAVDVHALFNSSHLTDAQRQTMFDDAQKILTDAGASLDDAVNTVTDLKKIAEETK